MSKKTILSLIIAFSLPVTLAFAATPALSVSGNGDSDTVNVIVSNAEINSAVALYFTSSNDSTTHSQVIGTTNQIGTFSGSVSTRTIGINNANPVYVMVNGYNSNSVTWPYVNNSSGQQITFSQTNPTIAPGQSSTVTVFGGNSGYYVSSNSNSGVLSVSMSGNTLSFTGINSGSSVVTVCSIGGGLCGLLTITTSGTPVTTPPTTNGIAFSPTSLTIGVNQSGSVQILGGVAPYTISTVSGESVRYSFSGDVLTLSGATLGTRSVRICSSNSQCSNLTVNVTSTPSASLTLSPSNLALTVGQTGTVQIMGGNAPYTVSSVSGNTLSTSIVNSTLTVSGASSGVTSLTICSQNGICSPLSVTVGGGTTGSNQSFSLPMAINQTIKITLLGGNGTDYYAQSSMPSVATPIISSNMLLVTGKVYGTNDVRVCQNSNGTCMTFTFVVNQASDPLTGTGGQYIFNKDLWFGQIDNDVTELQKYLIASNYLSSSATGYFGALTLDAVRKYQSANNISATGYVGPLTRNALNN